MVWRWLELTCEGRCFQGPQQKSVVLLVSRPDKEEQVNLRDAQIWVGAWKGSSTVRGGAGAVLLTPLLGLLALFPLGSCCVLGGLRS